VTGAGEALARMRLGGVDRPIPTPATLGALEGVWVGAGLPLNRLPNLPETDGWTPELLQRVLGYAAHAEPLGTGRLSIGASRGTYAVALMAEQLLLCGSLICKAGYRIPETLPWLAVIAGAPAMVWDSLYKEVMKAGNPDYVGVFRTWRALDSRLAAVAWAAGLSPLEAADELDAGTLTEDRSTMLASLRGFQIPPIGAIPDAEAGA
jgi:hypothetical protein